MTNPCCTNSFLPNYFRILDPVRILNWKVLFKFPFKITRISKCSKKPLDVENTNSMRWKTPFRKGSSINDVGPFFRFHDPLPPPVSPDCLWLDNPLRRRCFWRLWPTFFSRICTYFCLFFYKANVSSFFKLNWL